MTTHTPAPAQQALLTDDEIVAAIAVSANFDESDAAAWHPESLALGRAIESALLSKLRAPVADERMALQKLVGLEDMRLRLRALHEIGHGTDYDYYHKALPAAWDTARAALASAPVAGEAQRPHLNIVLDHAADRLAEAGMREDARIVRGMKVPNDGSKTESINAAPQASEAVRDAELEQTAAAVNTPDCLATESLDGVSNSVRDALEQYAKLRAQFPNHILEFDWTSPSDWSARLWAHPRDRLAMAWGCGKTPLEAFNDALAGYKARTAPSAQSGARKEQ